MNLEIPKKISMGLPPQVQNSKTSLLEIVLLLVISVLFFWFIILPKQAQVNVKNEQLQKYTADQEKMKDSLDTITKLVKELKSHTADVAKLDDAIPLEGKNTNLQFLIQKLADAAGVQVSDISISAKPGVVAGDVALLKDPFGAPRILQKLSGSAFILGSFSQIQLFMQKLETSGRVIQISNVEIQGGQNNSLSLKLVFDAYYFAQ